MPAFRDLTGQRFGRLVVIEIDLDKTKEKNLNYWKCKCDCGNIISTRSNNLTSGSTKSCGCLHKEIVSNNNFKDLSGMVFGRLKVLYLDEYKTKETGISQWVCKCDCGNKIIVPTSRLMSGHTKSCGCLRLDSTTKNNPIYYDETLDCLKVYFNNYDGYFLCDINDRDIIEKYCWCLNKSDGYVYAWNRKGINNTPIKVHRIIMSEYYNIDGFVIDHINHNKLDNRKLNLRICTNAENAINSRPYSNTGEKYISYDKRSNRYLVQFRTYNISKSFITIDDAIKFRDEYIENHPNEFYYKPEEDYINRNQQNIIHPFIFINPEERNKNNA